MKVDTSKLLKGLYKHFRKKSKDIRKTPNPDHYAYDMGVAQGYDHAADMMRDLLSSIEDDEEETELCQLL